MPSISMIMKSLSLSPFSINPTLHKHKSPLLLPFPFCPSLFSKSPTCPPLFFRTKAFSSSSSLNDPLPSLSSILIDGSNPAMHTGFASREIRVILGPMFVGKTTALLRRIQSESSNSLWLILWWKPIHLVLILSKMFFAGVSLFAAFGFLLYGGRLFLMLQRFPVESKGRRKKLQEVGYVTTICFFCFLVRCIMMCFNAFDKAADLDVLNHPVLNFLYYLLVEIVPSALVLFILRKLPPKRGITQYHPIH